MARRPAIPPGSIRACVFSDAFVRDEIDPRVKRAYDALGKRAPFGDFRRTWRQEHCARVAPYGECPYQRTDCAMAFLRVATLVAHADKPGAMFRKVAKSHALERADRKPSGRQEGREALGQLDPGPVGGTPRDGLAARSDAGIPADGDFALEEDALDELGEDWLPMRRPLSRPVRIGSLLGNLDPRPREVPASDGDEGT